MAKVNFLGTLPGLTESSPCNDLTYWGGLSLERAMEAYWKVKSWAIQAQIDYQYSPSAAISGTADVSSPNSGIFVTTERDLVCYSNRTFTSFSTSNGASNPLFSIGGTGWGLEFEFLESGQFYWPGGTYGVTIPITVTIGSFSTVINGTATQGGGYDTVTGGSGSITATSFWPYND